MSPRVIGHWSVVLVWSLVLGHWSFAAEVASPLSPVDAQKVMQLADDSLKIELAAAEPEVVDPVAIRFDEDGRMWVVEMRDYPLGVPGGPISRIRVLDDKDGDGRFETATTFADKLLFVTGLQPWKGGVFVTLSGAVVYMKDTDSDGKSDVEETWFEGLAELNSQLRANHPRLAIDNWIYVANGLRSTRVINRKLKEQGPINISGMDFRFDPLTGRAEAVSGNGQFGLCFDDWGNRFTCSNRNPVRHVVIEDRYLKANPNVTVPAVMHDVAAWGEQSRIFPVSRAWTTSNLHAGQFTAACGVYIYRGDLLPSEFKGNVFTCDPTGNLIHREVMQPAGPTFTSKSPYEGKEFLCSPDEWFRPVSMELGPDGALYVVDMYRCVIEHPDFVPDELKRRPDQRLGDDKGRIWRIVPKVGRSVPERPDVRTRPTLSKTSSEDLVPLLDHSNAWQRETAQRLLLERERRPVANALKKLLTDNKSPQSRIHALAILHSLGDLGEAEMTLAVKDNDPHVRRFAMLLAESLSDSGAIAVALTVPQDSDVLVRFGAHLLRCLVLTGSPRVERRQRGKENQLAMLVKDAHDPWHRYAICLSAKDQSATLASELINWSDRGLVADEGLASLLRDLCEQTATSDDDRVRMGCLVGMRVLEREAQMGLMALQGGLRGLARKKVPLANVASPERIATLRKLLIELVSETNQSAELRRDAVELIGYIPESSESIAPLLARSHSQPIRIAAIGALARQRGIQHWNELMGGFATDTPPVRRAILEGLLSSNDRTALLLDAIEAGKIKPSELDLQQTKRLLTHKDSGIKDRAAKLFESATPADRAKALADYQPALQISGDAKRGQVVFEKNCAACHRIAGVGVNVAPDISDSRTKKLDQLLGDILQPNRAIDNNYVGYTVRLLDGTVLTGILTTETATSITLRQQGGKDAVLARSEIDELRSSGVSLMPEGLERQIPPPEMADLLSFIKNWRYLDGRTPLSSQN